MGGWSDGSMVKVSAAQHEDLSRDPQFPLKKKLGYS